MVASEDALRLGQEASTAGFVTGKSLESVVQELEDSVNKGIAMARVFWDKSPFNYEEWSVAKGPDGKPLVEKIIDVPLQGAGGAARITCDLILEHRDLDEHGYRQLAIVDHKTTSKKPWEVWRAMERSIQLKLYRYGLASALAYWAERYPDYPKSCVKWGIYNIIKTAGIKYCPMTKDKSGFDSYIQRMEKWYEDNWSDDKHETPMLQNMHEFTGPPFPNSLRRAVAGAVHRNSSECNPDVFYEMGGYACHNFNRSCSYGALCDSSSAMWPGLIKDYYVVESREDSETPDYVIEE
jgi:hypothetical protein